MNMPTSLEYKRNLKVLIKDHAGSISVDDVMSFSHRFCKKSNVLNATKGLIFDCRNAFFDFEVDEHEAIGSILKDEVDLNKNLKIAVVSAQPYNVVITMMLANVGGRFDIAPFSTMEGAFDWICY